MQSLVRVALLAVAFFALFEVAQAEIVPSAPPNAAVAAGPAIELPLVAGQYSSDSSSSSGSTRIPRGAIKLVVFAIIGLFSAGAWVIKKMTAG